MRLRADNLIAGHPVLQIRSLLREWGTWDMPVEFISDKIPGRPAKTRALLRGLIAEGLLEPSTDPYRRTGEKRYGRTVKGAAFAQASAAKPLRRATVEKKLVELIGRMVEVNASKHFLVGVESAHVYGSYLTDTDSLGDLDVNLILYNKEKNPKRFAELSQDAAHESGRRFSNFMDVFFWPQTQVLLFLKQRSRVFSLHVNEQLLVQRPSVPRRAVFLKRRPVTAPAEREGGTTVSRARKSK